MAEVKNDENEPAFPSKRKPDLISVEKDGDAGKKQKLEPSDIAEEKIDGGEPDSVKDVVEDDENGEDDYGDEEEDEDEDEDEDEEDEEEDGEHSNGKAAAAEVDRKGKGIMREDKGKGKLIEEDDSSDDDSSDGEAELDGDSDLSDDPLAEVDLDNILPSRTRRRVVNPGAYLANDLGRNDDNDSDDSDA